jgi:predicted metal-dependent hydrolase
LDLGPWAYRIVLVRKVSPDQLALFPLDETAPVAAPPVDLVRSSRRRRTYKWSILDGRVRLEVPTGLRPSDEARIIQDVLERARKRLSRAACATDTELLERARDLARKFVPTSLPRLRSVAWSDRQGRRWGSCTIETGAIRLSSRLGSFPSYVMEAVLVHELAHLVEANHSRQFHALANTYPHAERARGFLEAIDRRLGQAGDSWAEGAE